ncbi:MAG: 4'-phosphopantetheinyl transferase superfamily protein [Halieaceae bacterium]
MTASSASKFSASKPMHALAPDEVHLWLCPLTDFPQPRQLDVLRELLQPEEWQRCQRLSGRQRDQAVVVRALLRTVLSSYAVESPRDWRFGRGRHGKPFLHSPSRSLSFNLSHSGDWIACTVAAGSAVGVDVQYCDEARNFLRLARRYFRAEELQALEALEQAGQAGRFYDLWTLKEAWTKARGDALPTALGAVGFDLAPAGHIAVSVAADPLPSVSWLLDLAPDYRLALCAEQQAGAAPRLSCFRVDPGQPGVPLQLAVKACSGPLSVAPSGEP